MKSVAAILLAIIILGLMIVPVHAHNYPYCIPTDADSFSYQIPKDTYLEDYIWNAREENPLDIISGPNHGTFTVIGTNPIQFRYTPYSGFEGTDKITYRLWTDYVGCIMVVGSPGTLTIVVGNPAPIPTPISEFPSAALPLTTIIGFLGAVLYIQRTREN